MITRTATLEKPAGASPRAAADASSLAGQPASRLDRAAVRAVTLARIAARDGATRGDLKKDVFSLASHVLSPGEWRQTLDMELGVLKADGLISEKAGRLRATEDGVLSTAAFLGLKGKLPATWPDIKDRHLVAKALGLKRLTARQLAGIDKPDVLRALVLKKAYGLKISGTATAAKIRLALAMVALQRAFGNQLTGGLESGSGLSAKAARLLAGQLARRPRDLGTDRRLIAALSAEVAGIPQTDMAHLQAALLRQLLSGQVLAQIPLDVNAGKSAAPQARSRRERATSGPGNKVPTKANGKAVAGKVAIEPATARRASARRQSGNQKADGEAAAGATEIAAPESQPRQTDGRRAVHAGGAMRPDLIGFAKEVHSRARACAKGWPGDRKAFISHIWQSILANRPEWSLSAIEFKCMLAEAHQAGHILLAYADLKGKDNIKDVQASAIAYKNTVWHYVRVEE